MKILDKPERMPAEQFGSATIARLERRRLELTFEADEQGEEGSIPLHILAGAEPGPTLLVLAAVHGDEYEGVQTVIELGRLLKPGDIRGTLLMVPVANPYAYRAANRCAPEDGRNLAREFPGNPEGTLTQRLAWQIAHRLIDQADFLLDLHSGGTYYEVAELVGYYDKDETEAGRRSKAAAEAFGLEVLWGHRETGPGRTITYANERGIPWLYTEAAGGRRIKRQEQLRFRQGALRLMNHLGMLVAPGCWIEGEAAQVICRLGGSGDFDGSVTAECEGFFIPEVELLQRVRRGAPIGAIYDGYGREKAELCAISDGVIVGLAGTPAVAVGSVVYMIAEEYEGEING
ncbi:hypothetical protein SAMN02799630_02929 [Paenibacillus sp. UNCCL117]|uniref:succinylglutamate desuccinylase/aspartoacylase family protein n=1 Tax=unclassified Paenibacillus TaxID=185978 RepID=UPI000885E952|nr:MULTISPECIES: succinylglutamate desuccinylase/aspartoacylase family protein [unclassified Paenibacillus]SDD24281.1 hypothetical protein SAMN04488602_10736 [Paenibacillus sp. cl123]SFW41517.1 hypothetical protein SAMN02799630_02929 [Paenibacillus sp. UNCCL117]